MRDDYILSVNDVIGDWVVTSLMGMGGTATVYEVLHRISQIEKALKRFDPDVMNNELEQRIRSEPELLLNSPYIIQPEAVFKHNEYWHQSMELAKDGSLKNLLDKENSLNEEWTLYAISQAARAAMALTRIGLVHTDFKPENLVIDLRDNIFKTIDLSCYERIGYPPGLSKGTESYACPELIYRKALRPNSDVYSLGVVLVESLVGQDMFSQMNDAWRMNYTYGKKPDILNDIKKIYPVTGRIIEKCIEADPNKRYANPDELCKDLENQYYVVIGSQCPSNQKSMTLVSVVTGNKIIVRPGNETLRRSKIDAQNICISRKHAIINFDGKSLRIKDDNSKNGTFVNGTRIGNSWINVANGDIVALADSAWRVEIV